MYSHIKTLASITFWFSLGLLGAVLLVKPELANADVFFSASKPSNVMPYSEARLVLASRFNNPAKTLSKQTLKKKRNHHSLMI